MKLVLDSCYPVDAGGSVSELTSSQVDGACSALPGTFDSMMPYGEAPRDMILRALLSYTSALAPYVMQAAAETCEGCPAKQEMPCNFGGKDSRPECRCLHPDTAP